MNKPRVLVKEGAQVVRLAVNVVVKRVSLGLRRMMVQKGLVRNRINNAADDGDAREYCTVTQDSRGDDCSRGTRIAIGNQRDKDQPSVLLGHQVLSGLDIFMRAVNVALGRD